MHRKASIYIVVMGACLVATPARAQFANTSLGLSFGYAKLSGDNLTYALPLTLRGSVYVEENFEVTASFGVAYLRLPGKHPDALLLLPTLGFRYLFLSETIRPYVGVDLSYLHLFGAATSTTGNDYVGLGPKAGVEFFTSEDFSLGIQAEAAFYFAAGQPLTTRLQLAATASVYF